MKRVDGFSHSAKVEDRLNFLAAHVFEESEAGRDFLAYLESITVRNHLSAGADPNTLMHLEGQRWIVGLIKKRIQLAKEKPDGNTYFPPPAAGA